MMEAHQDIIEPREIWLKRPSDKLPYYSYMASRVLGAIQLIAGLLSIALGVGAICTFAGGYDIGYGIWAGFMFCLSGILAIWAGYRLRISLVSATMTFCVISSLCAAAQMSLGIVAAVSDYDRSETGEYSRNRYYLDNDIYYERNNPFYNLYTYQCTETYGAFTWRKSWGPVDILLACVGFIEMIIAIATACVCCQAICCGRRRMDATVRGAYVAPSFYNDGYAESRISAPTTLKVVPN